MKFLEINIPEQPISWKRPGQTKDGHRYDSQHSLKERHSWIFKEAMMHAHQNITNKPLHIDFTFSFKRVKSNTRKYHITGCDIDNACKYYLDAMQDVCYLNDSQVVILSAKKIFSVQPGVNIAIFTID